MEKVLYDIYIAEGEINANYLIFSSDSTRKQELLNSVLKKHKITEAVLDTSLAWYSGNLEKYFKIHENLTKRYAEALEKLRKQAGIPEQGTLHSDDLVLPVEKERFFLSSSELQRNAYTFKADTTLFRYGGAYKLQLDVWGLSASHPPVVTLCVQCKDTIFVKRDTLSRNGLFISSVNVLPGKQAHKLYGSIYFPEIYSGMNVFIQNFTLSHSSRSLPAAQPSK